MSIADDQQVQATASDEITQAILNLYWMEDLEQVRVEWKGERTEHPNTPYLVDSIERFRNSTGPLPEKVVLKLEGRKGGRYEIDNNPGGPPLLRYKPPNSRNREEELVMFRYFVTEFTWEQE